MRGSYRGSGSASYHPSLLLGILVYGYATGVFSCRKMERATYDSVAFRFIAANQHPDHDTIASFRRPFLKQIEAFFVQVLVMVRETCRSPRLTASFTTPYYGDERREDTANAPLPTVTSSVLSATASAAVRKKSSPYRQPDTPRRQSSCRKALATSSSRHDP